MRESHWHTLKVVGVIALLVMFAAGITPKSEGAAVKEKVLTMSYFRDGVTLDPPKVPASPDDELIMNLYNGLVRFKPGTVELEPDLAERWTVSEDGLTYTFSLRKGVKFYKGYGDFTARDVKYSFERVRDPGLRSIYARDMAAIREIEIVDDYTIKLHLREPYADFLPAVLAYRPGYIVSRRAVEQFGDQFGRNPIGTGAYMLEKYIPGQESVFVANPDYFRGKPRIDRVIFKIIPDETIAVLAMAKGDLDFTIARSPDSFKLVKLHPGTLGYIATPAFARYGVMLNTKRPPLNDVRVRRALSHAVNRQEFVKAILEGLGTDQRIWSVLPPGVYGHVADVPTYPYDPDRAKALLATAGVNTGMRPLRLVLPRREEYWAVALQAYWAKVGVKVIVDGLDTAPLEAANSSGDWDMYLLGPVRVAPSQFLLYLQSTAVPNFYGEIDNLIEAQRREVNETKRKAILRQIQVKVATDVPIVPLFIQYYITAFRKVVTGAVPNYFLWLWYWEVMDIKD